MCMPTTRSIPSENGKDPISPFLFSSGRAEGKVFTGLGTISFASTDYRLGYSRKSQSFILQSPVSCQSLLPTSDFSSCTGDSTASLTA